MLRVTTLLLLSLGLAVGLDQTVFSQLDDPARNALKALDKAMDQGRLGGGDEVPAAVVPKARQDWRGGYSNTKYGYAVAYPESLFTPQGESDAGDGQQFLAAGGKASLVVYATFNVLEATLEEQYKDALARPGLTVTYKVLRKDWFVVSGLLGNDVYYTKTIAANEAFYVVALRYPQTLQETFNPLVGEIVKSFVVF